MMWRFINKIRHKSDRNVNIVDLNWVSRVEPYFSSFHQEAVWWFASRLLISEATQSRFLHETWKCACSSSGNIDPAPAHGKVASSFPFLTEHQVVSRIQLEDIWTPPLVIFIKPPSWTTCVDDSRTAISCPTCPMATWPISNAPTRRSKAPQCRRGRRRGASPRASRSPQVEAPASSHPYPMLSNRLRQPRLRPYPRRPTGQESPAVPRSSWLSTTSRPTGKSGAHCRRGASSRQECVADSGLQGLTSRRSYDSSQCWDTSRATAHWRLAHTRNTLQMHLCARSAMAGAQHWGQRSHLY